MTKRAFALLGVLAVLVAFVAVDAMAADRIINTQIQSATVSLDKNGNEYVRLIVQESRKLQGTEYTVGVPIMAFGEMAQKAKSFKSGDTLKCVASEREYQGRTSYTMRALLQ